MMQRAMIVGVACVWAGCVAPGEPSPADGDAAMVERTVVVFDAEGVEHVTRRMITAEQQRADLATRTRRIAGGEAPAPNDGVGERQQSVVTQWDCSDPAAMWIFDNDNTTVGTPPLNHEICFYNASSFDVCADLRTYARQCFSTPTTFFCQNWASATGNWIGSYWAGVHAGAFRDGANNVQQYFGPYQRQLGAQATVPRAALLCMNR